MIVTVAVCTWNRSGLLAATLERMTELEVPPDVDWELLVVNNNCTDDTDGVVASFVPRLPVRVISQPIPGLSNARNMAIGEAKGRYILWTDDDVLVDRRWLAHYAQAFRDSPEVVVMGGPIEAWFEEIPPSWLKDCFPMIQSAFAVKEECASDSILDARHCPYGANYAIRADVQRRYLYDPDLGRRTRGMVSGEEVDVISRILAGGGTGRWVPAARVKHFIPRERQTRAYLRRYFKGQANSEAMPPPRPLRSILGIPVWLLKRAVLQETTFRVKWVFGSSPYWIGNFVRASIDWGLAGRYLRNRFPKQPEDL